MTRQVAQRPVDATHTAHRGAPAQSTLAGLTLGAVGIVFGGIGTSPLYALDILFRGLAPGVPDPGTVVGGLSLVVWTLTVLVAFKYALFVLRADNDGEGGLLALYGLLHRFRRRSVLPFLWALMLGAGLLYGDGIITPAISVLSAFEGLGVVAPPLTTWALPATVAVLTVVFVAQARGVSGLGRVFGPLLATWFVVIAALGLHEILRHPGILAALDPRHGLRLLGSRGWYGSLLTLGALMLVVAGGEALYADLGHFGRRPIRVGWFALAYPALLLNYLGQGAYLLGGSPASAGKLFFSLAPPGLMLPLVGLAVVAASIASQSLIAGTFSLATQATALGLFPRLATRHTHDAHAGQVYVPFVNWALYAGSLALVLGFGSSAALGSAYGIAVAGVMTVTTLAMIAVARYCWSWRWLPTLLLWGALLALNGAFLAASMLKIRDGGFVPVSIGLLVFAVMATWRWGRKATFAAYSAKETMTVAELVQRHRESRHLLERTAVLMSPKPVRRDGDRTPALLQLLWDRYGVLPRHLIFVEVSHRKVPYVHEGRYAVTVFARDRARGSILGVELSFGFMEEPNVERALEGMARHREIDLATDHRQWIVHVSHENLLPARGLGPIGRLRLRLFLLLRRISQPAYYFYGLGDEVQLSAEVLPVRVR
ncbi:MAG: KUP/HAK/KT family potassium transporter [Proteobacteria bacterium]|nr:KUP/HAK/KT family potassium transporter [Pseudomonadota bacterium]